MSRLLDAVCPPQLKKLLFTTAAMDNSNHQRSRTSAKESFHERGLSLFRQRTEANCWIARRVAKEPSSA